MGSKNSQTLRLRNYSFLVFVLVASCSDDVRIKTFGSAKAVCSEEAGTCPSIERLSPVVAKPGATVIAYGKNLSSQTKLSADGSDLQVTVIDESSLSFAMPEGKNGFVSIEARLGTQRLALSASSDKVYRRVDAGYPIITVDPALVCSDIQFIDTEGALRTGTKICTIDDLDNLKAENIKAGVTIGAITGTLALQTACKADGEIDCLTSSTYAAALTTGLSAKVVAGQTVAGIAGSANASQYANCSGPNQSGCIATAIYKTLDLSSASSVSDLTASGFNAALASAASFEFWDSTGVRHQLAGDTNLSANKILSGTSLFGVTGSVTASPANCSNDGEAGCVVVGPSYAAAFKTGAQDKIISGQSVGGVAGTVTLPAAAKVLTATSYGVGGTALTGSLSLPLAADVRAGTAAYGETGALLTPAYNPDFPSAANVRASDTVNGLVGTLSDCNAANLAGCVTTASYKSMDLSAAGSDAALNAGNFNATIRTAGNFEFWDAAGTRHSVAGDSDLTAANVKNTIVIFGITGALTGAPANCTSDGQSNCLVDGGNYAAGALTGAASKILSGQTLAGVPGNVTLPAVGKVFAGINYGISGSGLTGTLTLPLANTVLTGSAAYGDPGAQLTPSYTPDFPSATNVRASDTVNGAAGTLDNCTAGNQADCVTTAIYKSMNLTGSGTDAGLTSANFNTTIRTAGNFEFWDATGTRHSLAADTDLSAANILSSANIYGVGGSATASPANCSANGSQACVATGSYFAATACGADGSNCFVPSYVASTQPLKAISYDAIDAGKASIRSSLTLSGIQGTLPTCAAGNTAGCVTTATYKSIDLSALGSNSSSGLTAANLHTSLATAANFEFWDASGTRHQIAGDADLSAANIANAVVIHGVTGTATLESHSPCNAANQSGCVATATYKTMDLSLAGADTDLTSGNFNATIRTAANFEFWDSAGERYQVAGDADLTAANILSTANIFGVAGSATAAPANCSSNGSQSCVASGSYFAATACTADSSNCFVPAYVQTTQPLKAISYDAIDAGKASIRTSLTLSGIGGTLADCNAGNTAGCVTTATYKSMDLSAMGTDTGLTAANFETRIATAANSEFWDATGARHSVTGDADLSVDKVKAGVVIHGVSGQYPSATYPLASNTGTTDLTLFTTQLTTDGSFEFFDSEGTRYTGSGDSELVNANIKNTVAVESLSLTGSFVSPLLCPSGWVKVPGDSDYGTADFCVMKYEAKNVSSVATSQAALTPWVSITPLAAMTACRALGTGYNMISNPQWMTLGSNTASINGNWTGGTVGSGYLFAGHHDSNPAARCAASSDDSLFYVETDCTPVSSGDTAEQRRTLTLSNSAVLWDLSGNVWDMVNYTNRGDKPGATSAWYEYTALSATVSTPLKDLIPTSAVKAFWSDAWNSGKRIGEFYPGTDGSAGMMDRGGDYGEGAEAGVFTATLNVSPSSSSSLLGFRCVSAPSP